MLSLTLLQPVMLQIGELTSYGEAANDSIFSKMTATPNAKTYSEYLKYLMEFSETFFSIGQNRTQIKVRT